MGRRGIRVRERERKTVRSFVRGLNQNQFQFLLLKFFCDNYYFPPGASFRLLQTQQFERPKSIALDDAFIYYDGYSTNPTAHPHHHEPRKKSGGWIRNIDRGGFVERERDCEDLGSLFRGYPDRANTNW